MYILFYLLLYISTTIFSFLLCSSLIFKFLFIFIKKPRLEKKSTRLEIKSNNIQNSEPNEHNMHESKEPTRENDIQAPLGKNFIQIMF